MPKFSSDQENYRSFVTDDVSFVMLPAYCEAPEFSGTILDAMGAYGRERVTPAISFRLPCDSRSADMINTVLGTRAYDFAYFAELQLANVVKIGLASGQETIDSRILSMRRNSQTILTRLLKNWPVWE